MDLQFHYELTKEVKMVSLQIVITWHGNNVYVSGMDQVHLSKVATITLKFCQVQVFQVKSKVCLST